MSLSTELAFSIVTSEFYVNIVPLHWLMSFQIFGLYGSKLKIIWIFIFLMYYSSSFSQSTTFLYSCKQNFSLKIFLNLAPSIDLSFKISSNLFSHHDNISKILGIP